jgi:hypothetical protein
MAAILKPFQVLSPRRSVPVGQVSIDWSHPLANGLIGCWLPGVSGGIDLTGNCADLQPSSGSSKKYSVNQEGPTLDPGTAGTVNMLTATAPPAYKGQQAMSMYYRAEKLRAADTQAILLYISYDNVPNAPYNVFGLQSVFNNTSYSQIYVGININGTSQQSANVDFSAETQIRVGATVTSVTGHALSLYKNGLLADNSTNTLPTGTLNGTSTSQISINGWDTSATSGRASGTAPYIACLWNRELSASEMAAIDADPYGFLVPANQNGLPALYVAAGGAGTDHLAAAATAQATATAALDIKHHLAAAAASLASATAALDVQTAGADHLAASATGVSAATAALDLKHHLAAAAASLATASAVLDLQHHLGASAADIASASAALDVVANNIKHLAAAASSVSSATAALTRIPAALPTQIRYGLKRARVRNSVKH